MTKKINFDELVDRANTDSNKWDKYRGTDILPLWVADTDFPVADEIVEALHRRIDHGVFGYTHPSQRLIELVVERMQRFYQWQIKPEWLVWVPGVVNGLNLACRSNGSAGDSVFVPSVIYPPFTDAPELSGRMGRPVPMVQNNRRWLIDLEWLEQPYYRGPEPARSTGSAGGRSAARRQYHVDDQRCCFAGAGPAG